MEIKRESINFNFLRRVIMRIDYTGMIDIQDSIKHIQDLLKENRFIEMTEDYINEIEFELNDPVAIESQNSIPLKEIQRTKTYKFRTSEKDIEFEINNLFIAFNLTVKKYRPYDTYGPLLVQIYDLLREMNPFLKPLRCGFRKINNCIVKDYTEIEKYFSDSIFPCLAKKISSESRKYKHLNSQYFDTIYDDRYMVNFIRVITEGEMNEEDGSLKEVYQIVMDIDGYCNNAEWLEELSDVKGSINFLFGELNDLLFSLYIESLTMEFINKLQNQDFNDDIIIGVKANEC